MRHSSNIHLRESLYREGASLGSIVPAEKWSGDSEGREVKKWQWQYLPLEAINRQCMVHSVERGCVLGRDEAWVIQGLVDRTLKTASKLP